MERFGSFYRQYRDKVFAYLMRMTGDYHLSGDIMQESFTRYLDKYGEAETPNGALIFTIARNVALDHFRKHGRNVQGSEEKDHHPQNPEAMVLIREEYRNVMRALQGLDATERELLALTVSSDLSYREMADITGISLSNFKVKVHRARMKLRTLLQEGDTAHESTHQSLHR